uniref:(northern house mosquito) hypothetical protein n=1 Tax=Culex pipiens TaxID=7175 RepID=A0A8D8DKG8_CULPI
MPVQVGEHLQLFVTLGLQLVERLVHVQVQVLVLVFIRERFVPEQRLIDTFWMCGAAAVQRIVQHVLLHQIRKVLLPRQIGKVRALVLFVQFNFLVHLAGVLEKVPYSTILQLGVDDLDVPLGCGLSRRRRTIVQVVIHVDGGHARGERWSSLRGRSLRWLWSFGLFQRRRVQTVFAVQRQIVLNFVIVFNLLVLLLRRLLLSLYARGTSTATTWAIFLIHGRGGRRGKLVPTSVAHSLVTGQIFVDIVSVHFTVGKFPVQGRRHCGAGTLHYSLLVRLFLIDSPNSGPVWNDALSHIFSPRTPPPSSSLAAKTVACV